MFDGWTVRRLADGVGLFPAAGFREGSARIRDRRRPLRSVRVVREAALGAIGGVRELGPIDRLTTDESELAAITTTGLEAGEHTLGLIFGDDFYTQVDMLCARADAFDHYRSLARSLVTRYGLGLGYARIRRPFYVPPEGWRGFPRGLATIWYPPGFPANRTAITVPPAIPLARPAELLSELIAERTTVAARPVATTPVRINKLDGSFASTIVGEVMRLQLELRDQRFRYGLQLECLVAEEKRRRPIFDALLESFEPIPPPPKPQVTDAFSFWTL